MKYFIYGATEQQFKYFDELCPQEYEVTKKRTCC